MQMKYGFVSCYNEDHNAYDTLYSQASTWRQNTEKNIFSVTNKFWVPNLYFLGA